MAYKAPIWEDGKSPAISAENLNNLSKAAEGAQVLYGNSAPTSSTKGAVGQFYLVVVADSDGNYPLYQCIAIANGSYVWRDTRRIPDSITSMLGIPAPGTINGALNVLAHVGNLHVWERVQTYAEPVPEVPAGYTLGEVETNVHISSLTSGNVGIRYGDSVTVSNDGTVSISNSSDANNSVSDWGYSAQYGKLNGKFCTVYYEAGVYVTKEVFFYPSGAYLRSDSNGLYATELQRVTGYPYTPAIPAGTHTDYLTSTDRNAYPDKSAEGGEPEKPAHYTLDEAETVDVLSSSADYTANVSSCALDSVIVNNDGSISTTSFSPVVSGSNALTMSGNWISFSPTKAYYIKSGSNNVVFTDTIFTVSEETTLTYSGGKYVLRGCRKLIGHAKVEAIPANTTITYLGQLGGGARIEVGSYVGTGTYGSSNPNTLTFEFEPQLVAIFNPAQNGNSVHKMFMLRNVLGASIWAGDENNLGVIVTWSAKSVTWYTYQSKDAACQMNYPGETYNYIAIG